jgi:hypothetical protein
MAANLKAELKDVESVMQFYKMHTDKCMWAIYSGVSMNLRLYDYVDESQPEAGEEMLHELLLLLNKDVTNTNVYTLQLVDSWKEYDNKGVIDRKFSGKAMRFQLHQPAPYGSNNNQPIIIKDERGNVLPTGNGGEVVELLKMMLQEQKEENNRLRELIENNQDPEEEQEEETEAIGATPELTTNEKIIGVVTKLAEREEVQEAIAGLLVGAQKWFNTKVLKNE